MLQYLVNEYPNGNERGFNLLGELVEGGEGGRCCGFGKTLGQVGGVWIL
jgi:hypothetical protein